MTWESVFTVGKWEVSVPQIVSVVALIYGGIVIMQFWDNPALGKTCTGKVHILVWTLGPPLWFFVEYLILKHALHYNDTKMANAKTWQDLATKFWAGVLAAMLFLTK